MTEHTEEENKNSEKRDELIFDLIKRRFDGELRRGTNLDNKAGSLVGFISIVVVLLLGAADLITEESEFLWRAQLSPGTIEILGGSGNLTSTSKGIFNLDLDSPKSQLYFCGIAVLLISIGLALCALKVRRGFAVPEVDILIKEFISLPYDVVLKRNAAEMAWVVKHNEKQNNFKGKLIDYSWILLIGGLVITFISVVLPKP